MNKPIQKHSPLWCKQNPIDSANTIAELEARESSWVALLCRDGDARVSAATRIIAKHTALEDGLRELIEVLDTQCMNSHVTRQLRELLDKEGES